MKQQQMEMEWNRANGFGSSCYYSAPLLLSSSSSSCCWYEYEVFLSSLSSGHFTAVRVGRIETNQQQQQQ